MSDIKRQAEAGSQEPESLSVLERTELKGKLWDEIAKHVPKHSKTAAFESLITQITPLLDSYNQGDYSKTEFVDRVLAVCAQVLKPYPHVLELRRFHVAIGKKHTLDDTLAGLRNIVRASLESKKAS